MKMKFMIFHFFFEINWQTIVNWNNVATLARSRKRGENRYAMSLSVSSATSQGKLKIELKRFLKYRMSSTFYIIT